MRKLMMILILAVFTFSTTAYAQDSKSEGFVGIAYQSTNFVEISDLKNLEVSTNENFVNLSFSLNSVDYDIKAEKLSGSDQLKFSTFDEKSNVYYNVLVDGDYITGSIINNGQSPQIRKKDHTHNFSFVISKNTTRKDLSEILNISKKDNQDQIQKNNTVRGKPEGLVTTLSSQLHVLASG